ncbi:Gamma-interferon-inducible lysosomal thiol reductase [Caenorhabditis elegans]|uniref:Gamma-interferon-inducible lysosomal thiol reductase n=1 Tax=Caenorhabditis elegans TaxID=6239 RepID=Q23569_CAEEL|nr:Gamma-interferon-inducible lysosomal thiol reductase [Caenorhabditis elegans]CAA85467.2 Gamma-interferon-inducible lysosomal thiol reductase [Caenorhabditis elegans]
MMPRLSIQLIFATWILPFVLGQNLLEIYKAMMADQASRAKTPPINIEFFGESLCPDTTRYFRNHIMPVWTSLQASSTINITYHPFGLASCRRSAETGIRCNCQHGPAECQLNMLQACVISTLQVPQLYLPIVNCMQGKNKFSSAVDDCIVNFRPRPDLDENFMARCAQSQLGAKLMMQHGYRQKEVASELDWVPWILINGRRSQAAENQLKTIVCQFSETSKQEYCKTQEELIF